MAIVNQIEVYIVAILQTVLRSIYVLIWNCISTNKRLVQRCYFAGALLAAVTAVPHRWV